jgi:DNA polymerase III delta prime subunit
MQKVVYFRESGNHQSEIHEQQQRLTRQAVSESNYRLTNGAMSNLNIYLINNIVMCFVYVTRQITSRRIQYSEFIPHSLLHLYNLQSHNYCHLQYYKYSCSHFCTLNNNGLHS